MSISVRIPASLACLCDGARALEADGTTVTHIEDFETGDVEHTDEVVTRETFLVKGHVTFGDDPVEDTGI